MVVIGFRANPPVVALVYLADAPNNTAIYVTSASFDNATNAFSTDPTDSQAAFLSPQGPMPASSLVFLNGSGIDFSQGLLYVYANATNASENAIVMLHAVAFGPAGFGSVGLPAALANASSNVVLPTGGSSPLGSAVFNVYPFSNTSFPSLLQYEQVLSNASLWITSCAACIDLVGLIAPVSSNYFFYRGSGALGVNMSTCPTATTSIAPSASAVVPVIAAGGLVVVGFRTASPNPLILLMSLTAIAANTSVVLTDGQYVTGVGFRSPSQTAVIAMPSVAPFVAFGINSTLYGFFPNSSITIYTGSASAPSFVYAIRFDGQPWTDIPPGLSNGTSPSGGPTVVALTANANQVFSAAVSQNASASTYLAALAHAANWATPTSSCFDPFLTTSLPFINNDNLASLPSTAFCTPSTVSASVSSPTPTPSPLVAGSFAVVAVRTSTPGSAIAVLALIDVTSTLSLLISNSLYSNANASFLNTSAVYEYPLPPTTAGHAVEIPLDGLLDLNTSTDSVFLLTGSMLQPNFLYGIHYSIAGTAWGLNSATGTSDLPPVLSEGLSAIALFGAINWAYAVASPPAVNATGDALLKSIGTQTNWQSSSSSCFQPMTLVPAAFHLNFTNSVLCATSSTVASATPTPTSQATAAGVLHAGDLVVVAFRASFPQTVALMATTNISAGTAVTVSNNVWFTDLNALQPFGGSFILNITVPLVAHDVLSISLQNGSVTLNPVGDNIFIYQNLSSTLVPSFIYGLTFTPTGWAAGSPNASSTSNLPSALVGPYNVALPTLANYVFEGTYSAAQAAQLTALTNASLWQGSNNPCFDVYAPLRSLNSNGLPSSGLVLPTCAAAVPTTTVAPPPTSTTTLSPQTNAVPTASATALTTTALPTASVSSTPTAAPYQRVFQPGEIVLVALSDLLSTLVMVPLIDVQPNTTVFLSTVFWTSSSDASFPSWSTTSGGVVGNYTFSDFALRGTAVTIDVETLYGMTFTTSGQGSVVFLFENHESDVRYAMCASVRVSGAD